jgi:rRNA maturation endonuclease Nob1
MPLTGKKYVLSNTRSSKRPQRSSMEILRRWLVQCPKCLEVRIVVGARENDRYVCKDCGHSFVIKRFIDDERESI